MKESYKHEIVVDVPVSLRELHVGDLFRFLNGKVVLVVIGSSDSKYSTKAVVVGDRGYSEYDPELMVERLELKYIKAALK